ncbi:hypothetical protein V6N11_031113 [Hibiscus sabdariffa]|uniref:Uncharacterized protein n=1 Tax=Hibiscus sabdariffa TaxID=183260 RepID=A0ABR1ZRY5_9ROSI
MALPHNLVGFFADEVGRSEPFSEIQSAPLRKYYEGNDGGEQEEIGKEFKEKESGSVIDEIVENFQCMNIAKRETNKREYSHEQNALLTPQQRSKAELANHDIPDLPRAKHGLWRQEQKSRAAKIEKQLKARRNMNSSKTGGSASCGIQSMFEKIALVITKAQKLRFKALELLVKKLLNQTEAAEFLVALSEVDKGFNNFNACNLITKIKFHY